jgi:hypothetical protein
MMNLPAKEKVADLEASSARSLTDTGNLGFHVASSSPALEKSFNLFSACSTGITTGNAWAVLGGAIVRNSFCLHKFLK